MINRYLSFLLTLSLVFLLSACKRDSVDPSKFLLTVGQCNTTGITVWPRDLQVDVFYFPAGTNADDALEQVSTEKRYPADTTLYVKRNQFNRKGKFTLKLDANAVAVLLVQSNDELGPDLTKYTWFETTNKQNNQLCIAYDCNGCR